MRRTASVQASTFLQVVCLSRQSFEECAEEMTIDCRKRVLAHILKSYNSGSALQQCSEPDFVYEETDATNRDEEKEDTEDTFNSKIDEQIDGNGEFGMEDDDYFERLMDVEESVENTNLKIDILNDKVDKMLSLIIKMSAAKVVAEIVEEN